MTIAVSIDGVSYDASDLIAADQRRISTFLSFASPRDINDLSQIYKYSVPAGAFSITGDKDANGTAQSFNLFSPEQFNTLIQTSYNAAGQPVYDMYFRDDNGVNHYLGGGTGANNVVIASPGNDATSGLLGQTGTLPDGTTLAIQAGDIVQDPGTAKKIVGRIKFEGESGLALAQINNRMADMNNVIEVLAKVLSTQSDMFNSASGIVR